MQWRSGMLVCNRLHTCSRGWVHKQLLSHHHTTDSVAGSSVLAAARTRLATEAASVTSVAGVSSLAAPPLITTLSILVRGPSAKLPSCVRCPPAEMEDDGGDGATPVAGSGTAAAAAIVPLLEGLVVLSATLTAGKADPPSAPHNGQEVAARSWRTSCFRALFSASSCWAAARLLPGCQSHREIGKLADNRTAKQPAYGSDRRGSGAS